MVFSLITWVLLVIFVWRALNAVLESPAALNDDCVFGFFASSKSLKALLYNFEGNLADAYPSWLSCWSLLCRTAALGFWIWLMIKPICWEFRFYSLGFGSSVAGGSLITLLPWTCPALFYIWRCITLSPISLPFYWALVVYWLCSRDVSFTRFIDVNCIGWVPEKILPFLTRF